VPLQTEAAHGCTPAHRGLLLHFPTGAKLEEATSFRTSAVRILLAAAERRSRGRACRRTEGFGGRLLRRGETGRQQ